MCHVDFGRGEPHPLQRKKNRQSKKKVKGLGLRHGITQGGQVTVKEKPEGMRSQSSHNLCQRGNVRQGRRALGLIGKRLQCGRPKHPQSWGGSGWSKKNGEMQTKKRPSGFKQAATRRCVAGGYNFRSEQEGCIPRRECTKWRTGQKKRKPWFGYTIKERCAGPGWDVTGALRGGGGRQERQKQIAWVKSSNLRHDKETRGEEEKVCLTKRRVVWRRTGAQTERRTASRSDLHGEREVWRRHNSARWLLKRGRLVGSKRSAEEKSVHNRSRERKKTQSPGEGKVVRQVGWAW